MPLQELDRISALLPVPLRNSETPESPCRPDQLLSGITHDLRSPLFALMGYLELIHRHLGEGAPTKVQEYLRLARETGSRLNQMANEMLDLLRSGQGSAAMRMEVVPVATLFKNLWTTFSVLAQERQIYLRLVVKGDEELAVWADAGLLERVLDNLLSNALKFTPKEGCITVTSFHAAGRTFFEVDDTGRGIALEDQVRIFDPFQQTRSGDRHQGFGLGLPIAKFIVEAHKGSMTVHSVPDHGSRFTLWIPDRTPA